jgi:hypothetical protein
LEVADDFHPEQTSSTVFLGIVIQIDNSVLLSIQGFHLQLRDTSVYVLIKKLHPTLAFAIRM